MAFIVLIILRFHPKESIITSGAISIFWSIPYLVFPDKQSIRFLQSEKRHQNLYDIQIIFSFLFEFNYNIYLAFVTQKISAYDSARIPQISSSEGNLEIDNKIVELEEDKAKVNQRPQTTLIRTDGREHKFLEYENNS